MIRTKERRVSLAVISLIVLILIDLGVIALGIIVGLGALALLLLSLPATFGMAAWMIDLMDELDRFREDSERLLQENMDAIMREYEILGKADEAPSDPTIAVLRARDLYI